LASNAFADMCLGGHERLRSADLTVRVPTSGDAIFDITKLNLDLRLTGYNGLALPRGVMKYRKKIRRSHSAMEPTRDSGIIIAAIYP
jgi:hypothetical protein